MTAIPAGEVSLAASLSWRVHREQRRWILQRLLDSSEPVTIEEIGRPKDVSPSSFERHLWNLVSTEAVSVLFPPKERQHALFYIEDDDRDWVSAVMDSVPVIRARKARPPEPERSPRPGAR